MGYVWEKIEQCDLCAGTDFVVVDGPGHILRCRQCGFMFTSPRTGLSAEMDNYDTFFVQEVEKYSSCEQRLQTFSERFKTVRKFCSHGDILDIGAGSGEFLELCRRSGDYRVRGTEVVDLLIDRAKTSFGITLDKGFLNEIGYSNDSFDVLTMWHVLEHVPSPHRMVREAKALLREGGFLFIAVPNESVWGRPQFLTNRIKSAINRISGRCIFKLKKMYPVYEKEWNWHLSHFTPATLRRLLTDAGFDVQLLMPDAHWERDHASAAKAWRKYRMAGILLRMTGVLFFNTMLVVARKKRSSCAAG